MRCLIVFAGLVVCHAGNSFAASDGALIEVVQGSAFLTTESGLTKAHTGMTLTVGQEVVLKDNATAILSNTETGCFVSLREAGTYRVPDMTECRAGTAMVLKAGFQITPTNGYPPPPPAPFVETSVESVVVGLGFAAVVAGAALYNTVVTTPDEAISGP